MCGRYIIDDSGDVVEMRRIIEEMKKHYNNTHEFQTFNKNFNREYKTGEIFPTDTVPVIIPAHELRIDAVPMQWGVSGYNNNLIINARSESVYEKKMFRNAIMNNRCIIPSNGFFEWAKLQDQKEKYLIKPAHTQMLYFAGLYHKLPDPINPGREQVRFVIITRESRGLIRSLHDRMPVTVERKDMLKWLNGDNNSIDEIFTDMRIPEYTFTNLGRVG